MRTGMEGGSEIECLGEKRGRREEGKRGRGEEGRGRGEEGRETDLHLLQILESIADHNTDTLVVPPNIELREKLLGFLDDNLVDLAQNNLFDLEKRNCLREGKERGRKERGTNILVFDQLGDDGSVSSTNNQNPL